jgi:hypothetical protein
MNALNFNAPSIASAAMLVDLSISQWKGLRRDKEASKNLADSVGAKQGHMTANKKLLGDSLELKAIDSFVAAVRTGVHQDMTMPWSNSGLRLLPTAKFFDYQKAITEQQNKFYDLLEAFLQSYEWARTEAKAALGSVFNDRDYPTRLVLATKFRFVVNYLPVPEVGDWRVDMGNTARDELARHYAKYYEEQNRTAVATLYEQTLKPLLHMSKKLADPVAGDKVNSRNVQTFRDSLVENVVEMIDRLETYNVMGDPAVRETRFKLQQMLDGITPDALREDDYLRRETKKKVDEVIASLPSMDNW